MENLMSGKRSQDDSPALRALQRALTYPARRIRRTIWKIKKRIYRPRLEVAASMQDSYPLRTLGTEYGGWTFVDRKELHGATIISCGLGTDGTFDVEFASHYHARVLIVDPTPKAIEHFEGIVHRLGQPATVPYSQKGNVPLEAYDLSALSTGDLTLESKAIWSEKKRLRFYVPPKDGVSHSIGNYLNYWRNDTPFIEVEATTLDDLMRSHGIADTPLLKLDIEGAEIEVIEDMMKKRIRPRQILVEYDELSRPSAYSRDRIEAAHNTLLSNGYKLIHDDGHMNFSYMRD
jgi:FkbM family methyltransferase